MTLLFTNGAQLKSRPGPMLEGLHNRGIQTMRKLKHCVRHLAVLGFASITAAVMADSVPGMGTWESTLQARDINGDGIVDAYYDTSSNLTWLADANAILTSGWRAPGTMPQPDALGRVTFYAASVWAPTLNVFGVTGWRLPTLAATSSCLPSLPHSCVGVITAGTSELQNLFTLTLGDRGGSVFNTGPFSNVQSGYYWTKTFDPSVSSSPGVYTYSGAAASHANQSQYINNIYAWAVHDGDVAAAVPEPASVALLAGGLGLMVWRIRRQARHAA